MQTFRDVMDGHKSCEIRCAYQGIVVRRLTVDGDLVHLDAITESCDVALDTALSFQPWVMDRGSILFDLNGRVAKLCGEFDLITYDDGTEAHATPPR